MDNTKVRKVEDLIHAARVKLAEVTVKLAEGDVLAAYAAAEEAEDWAFDVKDAINQIDPIRVR